MKNISIILILALGLFSCNENRIYSDHVTPPGELEWNKEDVITFDVKIIDVSSKNDIKLAFRHATGYAYPFCDVVVKETKPSGESTEERYQIRVMDDEGYVGEGAGDIYDIEEIWRSGHVFPEIGTYQYEIRHEMPDDKIHMVMEVGMIIDKSEN